MRPPSPDDFRNLRAFRKAYRKYADMEAVAAWFDKPTPADEAAQKTVQLAEPATTAVEISATTPRIPRPPGRPRGAKGRNPIGNDETILKLVGYAKTGMKTDAIARLMGISRRTAFALLRKAGYKRPRTDFKNLHLRFGFEDAGTFARAIHKENGEDNIPENMREEFHDLLGKLGMNTGELARTISTKAKVRLGRRGGVKTPIPSETKAEIIRQRRSGKEWKDIIRATGVPSPTAHSIYWQTNKYGDAAALRKWADQSRTTEEEKHEILALAANGKKPAEIAKLTGRSESTIHRTLRRSRGKPGRNDQAKS